MIAAPLVLAALTPRLVLTGCGASPLAEFRGGVNFIENVFAGSEAATTVERDNLGTENTRDTEPLPVLGVAAEIRAAEMNADLLDARDAATCLRDGAAIGFLAGSTLDVRRSDVEFDGFSSVDDGQTVDCTKATHDDPIWLCECVRDERIRKLTLFSGQAVFIHQADF